MGAATTAENIAHVSTIRIIGELRESRGVIDVGTLSETSVAAMGSMLIQLEDQDDHPVEM